MLAPALRYACERNEKYMEAKAKGLSIWVQMPTQTDEKFHTNAADNFVKLPDFRTRLLFKNIDLNTYESIGKVTECTLTDVSGAQKGRVKKKDQILDTTNKADHTRLTSQDPDHHVKLMLNAIEKGSTFRTQIEQNLETIDGNSSTAPASGQTGTSPMHHMGKLTPKNNPTNYFADTEQVAPSPSATVPALGPSTDNGHQAASPLPGAARYHVEPKHQQQPSSHAALAQRANAT